MIAILTGLAVLVIAGLIAAVGLLAGRDEPDLGPSPVGDLVPPAERGIRSRIRR